MRFTLIMLGLITAPAVVAAASSPTPAVKLVSDEIMKEQQQLTHVLRLKNGIQVVFRDVPNSEIVEVKVKFAFGIVDVETGKKALNEWLFNTMAQAAQGYPREKLYSIVEKYALELECSAGIEMSTCSLGTVNEYWETGINLLGAVVKNPLLTEQDAILQKDRLNAELRSRVQDPSEFVNDLVNEVFYPKGHPYRLRAEEALAELDRLNHQDLLHHHAQVVNAERITIIVAASLDKERVRKDLEGVFGDIKAQPTKRPAIANPPFTASNAYQFQARDIPTAYMRIKFNTAGILDTDAVGTMLMFQILDQELAEEIRTRRSLSYAVYAFPIQYAIGVGVIGVSTSQPEPTLKAISEVITALQAKSYSSEELDEFKRVFATEYFLTQETHGSLAGAIGRYYHYFASLVPLYELPNRIESVTPQDIQRLARQHLVNMQVGIIYDKKKFEDKWALAFIEKHAQKAKP